MYTISAGGVAPAAGTAAEAQLFDRPRLFEADNDELVLARLGSPDFTGPTQ